jgi:ribose-phosphate pyrophosphokinase
MKAMQPKHELRILSGRSHPSVAQAIVDELKVDLCPVELGNFANGEISARILESVRGDDVFIVQSHCGNVNDAIVEQAIMIDAAKRASAASITAVCPFFAYARQDRKANGREPISARLVVDMLVAAGVDRIVSMDLHTGQIQGFMDGPFDHLIARPLFVEYLKQHFSQDNLVIVSPDAGRVKSAERYSNALGCGMAIIHKHRSTTVRNSVEARHLIGDVAGKVCIVSDDMVDTAGTICAAAELLMQHGAKEVYATATHGLFCGPAKERIQDSSFVKVITTDTLPQDDTFTKSVVLPTAPVFAAAIKAIYTGSSLSALFDGDNQS